MFFEDLVMILVIIMILVMILVIIMILVMILKEWICLTSIRANLVMKTGVSHTTLI